MEANVTDGFVRIRYVWAVAQASFLTVLTESTLVAAANQGFTVANALAALLTAESLLFAATTVAIALSASSTLGVRRVIPPFPLAVASSAILFVVAFGAASAWWDVYAHAWPGSFTGQAQAISIIVGISAQPFFAAAIALNVKPSP